MYLTDNAPLTDTDVITRKFFSNIKPFVHIGEEFFFRIKQERNTEPGIE